MKLNSNIHRNYQTPMKKLTSSIIALALIFLFTGPVYSADNGNTTIQSFSKAKKILLRQVYQDHKTTFYCDCPFNSKKKILPSDNYTPKKNGKRAHRLEWNTLSRPMPLVRAFRNGEKGTLNVRLVKANPSRAGTVPGKWRLNLDTWNLIYTTWSRQ